MLRKTVLRMMLAVVIVELSGLVKLAYADQLEAQLPASAVWTHSDVYEIKLVKDGATHECTMISKGDELLVTVEIREPAKEPMTIGDKPENIVINGKIHRFKMNKKDGSLSDLIWMVYGETDKAQRFTNRAKAGPGTKRMLEPFREVLAKLPSEMCQLLKTVLR